MKKIIFVLNVIISLTSFSSFAQTGFRGAYLDSIINSYLVKETVTVNGDVNFEGKSYVIDSIQIIIPLNLKNNNHDLVDGFFVEFGDHYYFVNAELNSSFSLGSVHRLDIFDSNWRLIESWGLLDREIITRTKYISNAFNSMIAVQQYIPRYVSQKKKLIEEKISFPEINEVNWHLNLTFRMHADEFYSDDSFPINEFR